MALGYGRGEPVAQGGATAPSDPRRRVGFLAGSAMAAAVMAIASWATIFANDLFSHGDFFSGGTLARGADFAAALLGFHSSVAPAFVDPAQWVHKARLAAETLGMSVAAAGLAAVGALATFMFGARNVMVGSLAPHDSLLRRSPFFLIRALFTVSRAVPELVWAMILVFVFTQGTLPGVIALAIHNGGILGKLGSEIVEGLDTRPIRALRSTGAGWMQVLLYGVLPEALPKFITFLFYRWEVIIRTTIIVGFVAAGGLGAEFRLAMSHFKFTEVTLILFWYLVLVLFVDVTAARLRKLAQ